MRFMKLTYIKLLIPLMALFACTKMDHTYAPYLENGEIIYLGAPYQLEVHSGRERVEIQFTQSKDPNTVKYIIYWNNRQKKLEVQPDKANVVQKTLVTGLTESDYTFEIVAYDKAGNSSTPGSALVSGRALGSAFEAELFIRKVATMNCRKGMALDFSSVDTTCKYTVATYRNTMQAPVQRKISNTAALKDTLKDIDPLVDVITFRTAYVPEKGIDTFFAEKSQEINLANGQYVCTGTMVDFTSASLTGPYPWNVTLRQGTLRQLEMVDDDFSKDVLHKLQNNGANSTYGSFGAVLLFDARYNVISVVNKHGQPASNGRSAELDPSGVNKFDPATKVLRVKYWMNQPGTTHRTAFDEVLTMK